MKQTLQLKLGQQLKMTPQLQQAIRLLQLSTLDLQQEIQEALDSNPMLEVSEENEELSSSETSDTGDLASNSDKPELTSADNQTSPNNDASDSSDGANNNTDSLETAADFDSAEQWQEQIPTDLSVDTQWDDIYTNSPMPSQASNSDNDFDFDSKNSSTETLQDQLMWQLNLTSLVESDRVIATAIIDAIEPTGLLGTEPDNIFTPLSETMDIDFEEFEAVRQLIQQFEPIGVASKDLRECLLVQLAQFPDKTPFLNDARLIVDRYLNLLGSHDYAQLKRRTKFKEGRLKESIELIQSLTPHPGDSIDSGTTEYIVPDVFVKKSEGRWTVELNQDSAPKIRINDNYSSLVKRADNSDDNNFLRNNLQEARWFIKSLQSRNETLMKVSAKIVEYQLGFFEYGEEAMKPLVLHDIAEAIEMHESTISRVTTRKYMHTPRGIFELKYFFSSHVSTNEGGECSSTAIRAMIKKMIANENTKKPLSDNKIATLLVEQDIQVARRTVAKYRESMAIPPSNERKRLA
ncbi:MAG: RNA polymerase factor sigma-54 [Pseudomonadales bacterium]|nr:RNA polymerase factor sigma-54 [Pseudomonadales bacterium]